MSDALKWKAGTGRYIGSDQSTYVVAGADGQAFLVFVRGGSIGHGNKTRHIGKGTDGRLVVDTLHAHLERDRRPAIELHDNMEGWWEPSGKFVFTREEPAQQAEPEPAPAPAKKAVVSAAAAPVTVTAPVPPVVSAEKELPEEAKAVIRALRAKYRVYRGPGGITLLFFGREAFTPDQVTPDFRGYLQSEWRALLLRTLRQDASELSEVTVTRPAPEGHVVDLQRNGVPGWYWHVPGQKDVFICARGDGVRLSILPAYRFHWPAAINNRVGEWTKLLGFVTSGGYVYPRARSASDFEWLVHCPRGAAREVTALVEGLVHAGKTVAGLALVSFHVMHSRNGKVEFSITGRDEFVPPYVVALDSKGKGRVFRQP
jgi:hypothetical protein